MMDDCEGVIYLYIDKRVTMDEMKNWNPARIAAFFRGIALAVAAINAEPEAS